MLRNPLVLDGVKLWFSPKLSMKVGGTSRIVCLLPPLNPSTISAANPLVNCESESALMMTRSSIISTEIHTCEVQPGTLLASTRLSFDKGGSFFCQEEQLFVTKHGVWNHTERLH